MGEPEPGPAVVVLTALDLEYAAVRPYLSAVSRWTHPFGTIFEIGLLADTDFPVALALAGEGDATVATITERAITAFRPAAVLLVGVAGALKDSLAIGDVVVPTRVYSYQGGKDDAEGFRSRPQAWEADHGLIQLARYVARSPEWTATVRFKPIAAGAVLVDGRESATAARIRQHYEDAVAVEMESAGLSQAAHLAARCPVLVVRGISDRADGTKAASDAGGSQQLAAANAAAFAVVLLRAMAASAPPRTDTDARAEPARHQQVVFGAPGSVTYAVQNGDQHIHQD